MPFSNVIVDEGKRQLREGRRLFERARDLVDIFGPTDALHQDLRASLAALRSAMNHLEDTRRFEVAHQLLDEAGKLARRRFGSGCEFTFKDGTYFAECPVSLAHNRVGLSPAIEIQVSHCSICDQRPEECFHIRGWEYDGETCSEVITKAEIQGVWLVGRPNLPDARITSIGLDLEEIRQRAGPEFHPGVAVTCDRCLNRCPGVTRNFEGSGHG
jgi:hypothetical protein